MSGLFTPTRREFLQTAAGAALTVVFTRLAFAEAAPGHDWSQSPGKARSRIDGPAKVTGQKIYGRDFRARDMDGWPASERVAMVLRATSVDRVFQGIDLSSLPAALQPLRKIEHGDLAADRISLPGGTMVLPSGSPGLLVPAGEAATYFGQPVAILIFEDFETWRRARRELQFNDDILRYGAAAKPPPAPKPYPPATFLTRYVEDSIETFSQVLNGPSNPFADTPTPADTAARALRVKIEALMNEPGLRRFSGSYTTQVLDPMFMEPESGLAWLEPGAAGGTLHLVLGTQSTNGDIATTLGLFADRHCPIRLAKVVLNACYPGGGFGGRDTSAFPVLLALAAAYADGPVRIANDRFEQFASGLKQLGSVIEQRLAVDSAGRFQAIASRMSLQAGGANNYSQWVAELAAFTGGGGYRFDKVMIDAAAVPSAGVVAGSMRGFGGPQAFYAIECLVDEAAQALELDAIELRQRNVLLTGDRTVTGAPLIHDMRLAEICERARGHPLWADRAAMKRARDSDSRLYGVGFALANQAYGTGSDGVMAEVAIAADGSLTVRSNCIDMGNGSATSLALSTARHLGANARAVEMGAAAHFAALGLQSDTTPPGNPWEDPRWTADFMQSSSACLTGFHQVHAVEQAARLLFEAGLLPAACKLWAIAPASLGSSARWQDGNLTAPNLPPLPLAKIARQLHADNGFAAMMVHAYSQGDWVSADFLLDGVSRRCPLDGLSTRRAQATSWTIHERRNTTPPTPASANYGRSLYASSGALAAVEIDRRTGRVAVTAMQSFLDAGRIIQQDLVAGQSEGAVAMGIGYALLEDLPLLGDGAGSGRWNLDRYHVARWGDMPLGRIGLDLLPATEDTGKGIAEAVLCPIAPAIANAVAHATGQRFRDLPLTPEKIRKALG
ncbi:MAG TPA: molybdopterin cofactor-binding domain-containing protein [Verrucomicrobiae bacterium]|nr:molybdopterin cofactor-binding domain-containing protein [Verrucomicrobiae bacterium]